MGSMSTARQATTSRDRVVSGIESIEDIGGEQLRITYYINRREAGGRMRRVPLDECDIMPKSAMFDAIGKGMMAVGRYICATDGSLKLVQ